MKLVSQNLFLLKMLILVYSFAVSLNNRIPYIQKCHILLSVKILFYTFHGHHIDTFQCIFVYFCIIKHLFISLKIYKIKKSNICIQKSSDQQAFVLILYFTFIFIHQRTKNTSKQLFFYVSHSKYYIHRVIDKL